MTQPRRLSEGGGPASRLLRASAMRGPSQASRAKALAVAGAAASLATTGTAAAGVSAKLVVSGGLSVTKTIALCVLVGVAGGGLVSFAVSAGVARYDAHAVESAKIAPAPRKPSKLRGGDDPRVRETSAPAPVETAVTEPLEPVPRPAPEAPAAPTAAVDGAAVAGIGTARASAATQAPAAATVIAPRGSSDSFDEVAPASLLDEVQLLEAARGAARRNDAVATLAALDKYARTFPHPQFGPEALALRIEALSRSGSTSEARALAVQFAQRYPTHPLLSRVQGAVR